MKKKLALVLAIVMLSVVVMTGLGAAQVDEFTFVIVPKVVHPWFDLVHEGAVEMANVLERETGDSFVIDYRAPATADLAEQIRILEHAAAMMPSGIALDPLDAEGVRPVIEAIQAKGIPILVFCAYGPEGMGLTEVRHDFVAEKLTQLDMLMALLHETFPEEDVYQIALIEGVPTAPNHKVRFETSLAYFEGRPDVEIVAHAVDNDSIELAHRHAATIIAAHPGLDALVAHNAAGPIGIGLAIREAGKVGEILHVGHDDLPELLELMKEGVIHSSTSAKPKMQGAYSVLALWMQSLGVDTPALICTGYAIITPDMIPEDVRDWEGW